MPGFTARVSYSGKEAAGHSFAPPDLSPSKSLADEFFLGRAMRWSSPGLQRSGLQARENVRYFYFAHQSLAACGYCKPGGNGFTTRGPDAG
jgi:hypothetical protein